MIMEYIFYHYTNNICQGVHSVRKVRIGQDISVTLGMVRKNMEKLGKKSENLKYCPWSGKTQRLTHLNALLTT